MNDQTYMMLGGLILGALQKHWFTGKAWYRPNIPNDLIPFINPLIGAAVGEWLGVGMEYGTLAGAASVGSHQAYSKVRDRVLVFPKAPKDVK